LIRFGRSEPDWRQKQLLLGPSGLGCGSICRDEAEMLKL